MMGGSTFGMGVILGFKNNAKSGMRGATRDFNTMRMSASKADKQVAAGYAMMGKGVRRAGIAAALGGAVVAMAAFGHKTEQAAADLRSLGLSKKEVDDLTKSYHQLLVAGKAPIDFRLGEGSMYDMTSASIAAKDLNAALKETAYLSKATMGTVDDAAIVMGLAYEHMFRKMGGSPAENAKRTADIFAATVKSYRTKLPGLSKEFAESVGAIPSTWSLRDVMPLLGTVIGTFEGQTGAKVKSFMAKLPVAEKILGMKFHDQAGMTLKPLEIIDKFIVKYGDAIDKTEKLSLIKAFGAEQYDIIPLLMRLRHRYVEGYELAGKMGLAYEMAGFRVDTLGGSMQTTGNALVGFGNTVSDQGVDLKSWVDNLNDGIISLDALALKYSTIPKGMQYGVLGLGTYLGGGALIRVFVGAGKAWAPIVSKLLATSFMKALIPLLAIALPPVLAVALSYAAIKGAMRQTMGGYSSWEEYERAMKQKFEVFDPTTGITKMYGAGMRPTTAKHGALGAGSAFGSSFAIPYSGPDMSEKDIIARGGMIERPEGIVGGSGSSVETNVTVNPTIRIDAGKTGWNKELERQLNQVMQDVQWQQIRRGEQPKGH